MSPSTEMGKALSSTETGKMPPSTEMNRQGVTLHRNGCGATLCRNRLGPSFYINRQETLWVDAMVIIHPGKIIIVLQFILEMMIG